MAVREICSLEINMVFTISAHLSLKNQVTRSTLPLTGINMDQGGASKRCTKGVQRHQTWVIAAEKIQQGQIPAVQPLDIGSKLVMSVATPKLSKSAKMALLSHIWRSLADATKLLVCGPKK